MEETREFEVTLYVTVTVQARDWAEAVDEARSYVQEVGAELDVVEPRSVNGHELIHIPLPEGVPEWVREPDEVDMARPGLLSSLNTALAQEVE